MCLCNMQTLVKFQKLSKWTLCISICFKVVFCTVYLKLCALLYYPQWYDITLIMKIMKQYLNIISLTIIIIVLYIPTQIIHLYIIHNLGINHNWLIPPWYNWHIVESGVKHHNPNHDWLIHIRSVCVEADTVF
jgi:hypothetical protein